VDSNRFGIGTNAPTNKLEVVGDAAKFDSVIIVNGANAGFVLTSDATGNASWQPATSGAFATSGNVTSNSPGDLTNDDFLFGSTSLADDGDPNHTSRMFFDKSLSAFRVGDFGAGIADGNVGQYSFASGVATRADGSGTVAMGIASLAIGNNSFAVGVSSTANGDNSIVIGTSNSAATRADAIGPVNHANGNSSFAIGNQVTVNGASSYGYGNGLNIGGNGAYSFGNFNTVNGDNTMGLGSQN